MSGEWWTLWQWFQWILILPVGGFHVLLYHFIRLYLSVFYNNDVITYLSWRGNHFLLFLVGSLKVLLEVAPCLLVCQFLAPFTYRIITDNYIGHGDDLLVDQHATCDELLFRYWKFPYFLFSWWVSPGGFLGIYGQIMFTLFLSM